MSESIALNGPEIESLALGSPEARLVEAELKAAKLEARLRHGIPEEHADLLTAKTPEELDTQGQALANLLAGTNQPASMHIPAEGGFPANQQMITDPLERELRKAIGLPQR